jgi:hypothetical protein
MEPFPLVHAAGLYQLPCSGSLPTWRRIDGGGPSCAVARRQWLAERSAGPGHSMNGITLSALAMCRDGRASHPCTGQSTLPLGCPHPIPPVARLRQLEHYASRVEQGEPLSVSEEEEEIALLVAPGGSLGGARPKATFQDDDGSLWIAKFPSRSDEWDVAAWEFTMHQLAAKAGITVPSARLIRLSGAQRTFIAQRFDRSGSERHLFASAMTLTSQHDHHP